MAVAIIGIITAVPIIGSFFDLFRILTMVLLGFSIYLLVKQPKEIKKTASILMIISCVLVLIGNLLSIVSFASVASSVSDLSSSDSFSNESGEALGAVIGSSFLSMIFLFPAWVLKILAIVFSFQNSNRLKKME